LPGSHHLHLEDPQPVAAAIRDFLANASEAQA
jgi:pimeloyl-ACP methyl ester carboxylesterase